MKRILATAALAMLAGCAGVSEAMKYDQTVHHVKMPDDTYRIFEYPGGTKIMVTPSLGAGVGQGFASGITLGVARFDTPEQRLEAAARKYLDDTGRANCKLGNGYELIRGQFEFAVNCEAPA